MTNNLDSLAKLATALGRTPAQIGELVQAPADRVQTWIDGTARPGEETRARLEMIVGRAYVAAVNGRVANWRQSDLRALQVALQSTSERRQWLAKAAATRALYSN